MNVKAFVDRESGKDDDSELKESKQINEEVIFFRRRTVNG